MAETNKVSLGCGTLILIALIVLIFGNTNRKVDKRIDRQLEDLKSEIAKQSGTLAEIRQSLDEIKKRNSQPRPRVVPPAPRPEISPVPPILEAPVPEQAPENTRPEN